MKKPKRNKSLIKFSIRKESLIRAIRVGILVGILLNIINNPAIFSLSFDNLNIYRVILTFLVPFCVSLYSSVLANLKKYPEPLA